MKLQTAVIIFYFCHFSSSNRGPTGQEHKCEATGSSRQCCPCKAPLEKDSESYNYCSINIGTKLNLYISVDHSVMLPQIVLEEKKKYILVFHTMCVVPKRMTVLVHQWIHYPEETVVYFKPVGPMRKEPCCGARWTLGWTSSLTPAARMCFHARPLFPPSMCPLVSNRSL